MTELAHLINGQWRVGDGVEMCKINPASGLEIFICRSASPQMVEQAVAAARGAFVEWSQHRSLSERQEILLRFAATVTSEAKSLSGLISAETGKPQWEAATEVQAIVGKIALSIEAFERRCSEFPGGTAVTRFRPHGVVAVPGPFNFPGHLPNGHIVPALLAGNTVVFKPSEHAPQTGIRMAELWTESGLPPGVLNLIQGAGETGRDLVEHPDLNGVFFTGSAGVGEKLRQHFARHPGKILALEMGGNNPLVVDRVENRAAAVFITLQSAFLSAGQRCTCARRLIVPTGTWGDEFVAALGASIDSLVVGPPEQSPEPFMGPVISEATARGILAAQDSLIRRGGLAISEARHITPGTGLLRPGVIDVTNVPDREDEEIFGPLLQLIRVPDFVAAIAEANRTCYGLAAGLISDQHQRWETFRTEVRAGIMNWNQPTVGASSATPFGGIGRSGNFRPSAFFAADYCSWPTASIEVEKLDLPTKLPPGLTV